jgi:hypothetical protein
MKFLIEGTEWVANHHKECFFAETFNPYILEAEDLDNVIQILENDSNISSFNIFQISEYPIYYKEGLDVSY